MDHFGDALIILIVKELEIAWDVLEKERDEEREEENRRFKKSRIYADDRRDKEVLDKLMRTIGEHDLKEGQKCSFNKKGEK